MTNLKTVLCIGIDPTGSTIPGPAHVKQVASDPDHLRNTIKAQMQKVKEAGYNFETKQIKPQDFDSGLEWLKEKLASQQWDIFIVGGGIRQTPDFTPFFEKAVNASREITPGTKLGFNTTPYDLYDTIVRVDQG